MCIRDRLGVVTDGMFGGTLTFTIPLGFGLIEKEDVPWCSRGILIGVGCIPVGSIVSGLLLQIPVREVLWNSLPVLLMSVPVSYTHLFVSFIPEAKKLYFQILTDLSRLCLQK